MDAVDQLDQAVSLALQGSNATLKSQALEFVAAVEADAAAWLSPALEIVAQPNKPDTTKFFALQIVDRVASNPSTPLDTLSHIRVQLWSSASAVTTESMPAHVRNKLAESLKALFVRLYPAEWPSFFMDLLSVADQNSAGADLYIRVLQAVHNEIGDQLFLRDAAEATKANALKDAVRDRDVVRLAESWVRFLDNGENSIIDGIMRVMAGWVVWIDVALLLPAVPRILKQLGNPATRSSAAHAASELLAKKMAPAFKLELVEATGIINALKTVDRGDPEFGEQLAKLLNTVLFEAAHGLNEIPDSTAPVGIGLERVIDDSFPLLLEFFGNEYDDTSVQLVPGITEYLNFVRKESRRDKKISFTGELSTSRTEKLNLLLEKLIAKSRYDPDDYDLGGLSDEEEESEFEEFRAKIRILQEHLAQINTQLFLEVVGSSVSEAFNKSTTSDWTALELALYELSVYGDVARQWSVKATKAGGELATIAVQVQQIQMQLFSQMVGAASDSEAWKHAGVQLWYMELVHRQAPQFEKAPKDSIEYRELLTKALDFFLKHGVQSPEPKVRIRSWYMFYRLIRAVRRSPLIAQADVGPTVFAAVAPLLPISVAPPRTEDLVIAAQQDPVFVAQLHLYELCGILFVVGDNTAQLADLARQLLATIFADIDAATVGKGDDPEPVRYLRVHHNIVALSALTKGIGDTAAELPNKDLSDLEAQLKTATQMVVAVLERLHAIQLVREACRQAFSRMLGFLGSKILLEISNFIDVLLQTSSAEDLGDLLSFLGQLAHEFASDAQVFEMFASLSVPLFKKVFSTLQAAAQTADVENEGSTDAELFRRDIVASYLQLVSNMLNNQYGAMLFPTLDDVLTSLLHYSQHGNVKGGSGSAANQKTAVGVLTKMVMLWGTGKVEPPQHYAEMTVPLFSDESTYERLTQLCWTLTATPSTNLDDAQSRMVVMELAGLQKALWDTRGPQYQEHLVQYLLHGAGMPQVAVEEFVVKLNSPPKDFKRFFIAFLQRVMSK